MTVSLASLLIQETKQAIYETALRVGESLGLPVTAWFAGEPTRSNYWALAEVLSTLEAVAVDYVASGFLDFAAAEPRRYNWLVLKADQDFGYIADEATYASTSVTLTNGGAYQYDVEAGDLTLQSSTTKKTYHSTSGGTLASGPGTTLAIDVVADEAGSGSSAGATEIDTLITGLAGVTVSNPSAATGTDAESAQSIVAGARAKLGPMSSEGPWDAYDSIARDAEKTGTLGVTRSRTYGDSTTGDVLLYLAGPSGAVSGADVTAVEAACATWAVPNCVTLSVASSANRVVPVTYELWVYESIGLTQVEIEAAISDAFDALLLERPIGGDIKAAVGSGLFYRSMIMSAIRQAVGAEYFVDVAVTSPAADLPMTLDQVATKGAMTATAIHFEAAA